MHLVNSMRGIVDIINCGPSICSPRHRHRASANTYGSRYPAICRAFCTSQNPADSGRGKVNVKTFITQCLLLCGRDMFTELFSQIPIYLLYRTEVMVVVVILRGVFRYPCALLQALCIRTTLRSSSQHSHQLRTHAQQIRVSLH
ncbi:hypothetical protein PS880_06305 [Pseudomonas fluorescens]|uniref:Uncharacterized protein n=1 Tax=Pseudomonas fluorescens TaxID=294 RepID=A0A5E7QJ55_PSEFL|nr:hypothetical protein PS880_06305 [Pseudomonas fluorescens]